MGIKQNACYMLCIFNTMKVFLLPVVTCHFVFPLFFLEESFNLDTWHPFMCRTLVHLLPHKWRRVAQPKVVLRRYRNYFHLIIFLSCFFFLFTCQLFVFPSLFFFQHMIYLVSSVLVCLALNTFRRGYGRAKYYTRPSLLFCQPSLAYRNITPTVTRHSRIAYRKLIFLKESSLFLLSALID